MVVEESGDGCLEEVPWEGARGCIGACRVPYVVVDVPGADFRTFSVL